MIRNAGEIRNTHKREQGVVESLCACGNHAQEGQKELGGTERGIE